MTEPNDQDREIAQLKAKLAAAEASKAAAPTTVKVKGSAFRGGFFGCFGVVAAIFVLIIVVIAMGKCGRNSAGVAGAGATPAPTVVPTDQASQSSSTAAAVPAHSWVYAEIADPMHDAKIRTACVTSTNQAHLDFPYKDTDADLCVRSAPDSGLNVYVTLNGNGQILCELFTCTLHLRFDSGPVESFPAVGTKDNSTNMIFIRRETKLVTALKQSTRTIVQLNLYQAGDQALTFDTAGLKWP